MQVNLCQKLFFLHNMERTCCIQKLFWMSETISVHNMFSPCSPQLGIFMYWTCNSMNNLSSYCGLVDAKIRASDKDLPEQKSHFETNWPLDLQKGAQNDAKACLLPHRKGSCALLPHRNNGWACLLPYRAPYIHNGGDSSFREGPARKNLLKFIYSEKATKFFEIFTLLLTGTSYTPGLSKF